MYELALDLTHSGLQIMKSCREISMLVSESMDRDLSLRERFGLWLHLKMCRLCAGFAADIHRIRRAVRHQLAAPGARESPQATDENDSKQLPAAARDRIRTAIRNKL